MSLCLSSKEMKKEYYSNSKSRQAGVGGSRKSNSQELVRNYCMSTTAGEKPYT